MCALSLECTTRGREARALFFGRLELLPPSLGYKEADDASSRKNVKDRLFGVRDLRFMPRKAGCLAMCARGGGVGGGGCGCN